MSDVPLSQDDIDAALAAAGLNAEAASTPAAPAPPPVDTRVDAAGNPFDETAAMMAAALEEEKAAAAAAPPPPVSTVAMPDFKGVLPEGATSQSIDLLRDVNLHVKIELGRSRMLVDDVLRLNKGSVVALDKLAGAPVDVLVNEKLVARGEVLVLNDNFCVRISEIMSPVEESA